MIKHLETAQEVLKALKCTNIKTYSLVNNYGCTFDLKDRHYDIRFWANCYGMELNEWKPMRLNEGKPKDEIDDFVYSALDYMFNYSNIHE